MAVNDPIFIVGAPRSGTTLLQYMLRSHPNIGIPTGESHFFIPLLKNEDKYGDLSRLDNVKKVLQVMYKQSQDFLDTDLHGIKFEIGSIAEKIVDSGINSMEGIIASIFTYNAEGEGKKRWGDKTPYYVLHMPFIKSFFPDAQFIHIIRDGRDCALSMIERQKDFGIINMYHAAKYWQQYVETGKMDGENLGKDHYLEIRYEELLDCPEKSLRTICDFLGEPYSETLINFKKSSERGKTPLLQSPIQKKNKNKWKTKMSNQEIKIFEGAAGNTLKKYGYDLENPDYIMSWLIRVYNRVLITLPFMKIKLKNKLQNFLGNE